MKRAGIVHVSILFLFDLNSSAKTPDLPSKNRKAANARLPFSTSDIPIAAAPNDDIILS